MSESRSPLENLRWSFVTFSSSCSSLFRFARYRNVTSYTNASKRMKKDEGIREYKNGIEKMRNTKLEMEKRKLTRKKEIENKRDTGMEHSYEREKERGIEIYIERRGEVSTS